MLGGAIKRSSTSNTVWVSRTEEVIADESGKLPLPKDHLSGETLTPTAYVGRPIRFINYGGGATPAEGYKSQGGRTQINVGANETSKAMAANDTLKFNNPAMGISSQYAMKGDHVRIFWEEQVTTADSAVEVVISPDTFPGTYKVVGDTFMRSEKTGKDEAFQFIIGKAKVLSEVTITLEAEGDPSTFEMQLNVLRSTGDEGNEMMRLVRYGTGTASGSTSGTDEGSLGGSEG